MKFILLAAKLLHLVWQCEASLLGPQDTTVTVTVTTTVNQKPSITKPSAQPKSTTAIVPKTPMSPSEASPLAAKLASEKMNPPPPACAPFCFPGRGRPRPPPTSQPEILYASFDNNRPGGSAPDSAYQCWHSHIDYYNTSIAFQRTKMQTVYTTWTETTSDMLTFVHNDSAKSFNFKCDRAGRLVGGETETRLTLLFSTTVTHSRRVHPMPRPFCSVKDMTCHNLFSVFDSSKYSFLSQTIFKGLTSSGSSDIPSFEFDHLRPPCWRQPDCPAAQGETQFCKLNAERATIFYWPDAAKISTPPTKEICDRNPLTVPMPVVVQNPPPTATFESWTVTSPTPLLILRSLKASVFHTRDFKSVLSSISPHATYIPPTGSIRSIPHDGINWKIPYASFRNCGPVLDATLIIAPQEYTSFRSIFEPIEVRVFKEQSTSITRYRTDATKYPFDFGDLHPKESVPYDAFIGSVGCNTLAACENKTEAIEPFCSITLRAQDPYSSTKGPELVGSPGKVEVTTTTMDSYWGYNDYTKFLTKNCHKAFDPALYTPALLMPKTVTAIAPEYELCEPQAIELMTYIPITDSSLAMPLWTRWVANLPQEMTKTDIDLKSILPYVKPEFYTPTIGPDALQVIPWFKHQDGQD